MKNLGHFDPRAVELFEANFAENFEFSEKDEAFDFARCQRADGSFYGTSGQCRKGKDTGAKEKEAKKASANKARSEKMSAKGAKSRLLKEELEKRRDKMKGASSAEINKQLKAANAAAEKRAAAGEGKKPSGNTKSPTTKASGMNAGDKKRASEAAKVREIRKEMGPKAKEAAARAKDLNKEADRLQKALEKQRKVVAKSPSKENKDRLKLIQNETRMAGRAAEKASRESDKIDLQMERAMRKATGARQKAIPSW